MTSAVNTGIFLANSNENILGEDYFLPNDSSSDGNSPIKDDFNNRPQTIDEDDNVQSWKSVLKKAGMVYSEYDTDLARVYVNEETVEIVIGFSESYGYNYDIFTKNLEKDCEVTNFIQQLNAISISVPIAKLDSTMSTYENLGYVRYVQPNQVITVDGVPNDPEWSQQWGPQRIDLPKAWALETGDFSEVLVAIIDSGIDYTHPDLSSQYVALGYDWYNGDNDPMDDYSHGTHCAGIVAATINNSVGIAGVANVKIMAEKFLSSGGSGVALDAANSIIHAVDAGADILSNSWGGGAPDILIEDALKYAAANDVVIIASAGNSASDMPNYPAYYPQAISVSATNEYDQLAGFSTYGSTIEIAAPGDSIYSTLPVSMGNYGFKSGTSMACPHVSGVAALIKSAFPSWSAERIRERLQEATEDLGDPGRDIYFGYGLINAWYAVLPPQPHDLKVVVEAPTTQNVNSSVQLNATISNFGLNNEINVELELYINNSLVANELFLELNINENENLTYIWEPTEYGAYNITAYAVPVVGETWTINNNATFYSNVVPPEKRILFIHNHGEHSYLDSLFDLYTSLGYFVDVFTSGTITNVLLSNYRFAFTSEGGIEWLTSEITAIQNFMLSGGIFAGIGDSGPAYGTEELAALYGITFTGFIGGVSGTTTVVNTFNQIMNGVTTLYLPGVFNAITVTAPAEWLLKESTSNYIYGAAVDVGSGYFVVLADDFGLYALAEDNEIMFENLLHLQKNEHDIATVLDVDTPHFNEESSINVTVINRGLKNETNIDIELYINDSLVASKTVTNLNTLTMENLDYSWTPLEYGTYNITAYATIVFNDSKPENNIQTEFVQVVNLDNYNMLENVIYDWIDTTGGTLIPLLDDSSATIPLPFNFKFYDNKFDEIYVSSNGWLSFDYPGNSHLSGPPFPSTMSHTNYAMALYWIDLYPASNVYYLTLTNPNRFVIIYNNINYFGGELAGSFEVILYETGEILFQYKDLTNLRTPTSVGLNYGLDIEYYNFVDPIAEPFIGYMDTYSFLFSTRTPEHELVASLEIDKRMKTGETQYINATSYNLGNNTETDVEVRLWMNNSMVASDIYPEVSINGIGILYYPFEATIKGSINVTFEIIPVLDEEYLFNNKITKFITVLDASDIVVGILDSIVEPSYSEGGFRNDYITLYNGLLSVGIEPIIVTNDDIISGTLDTLTILILIDNLPSDSASGIIGNWCLSGGNILSFDSSICLLNYEGLLPAEAAGTNGKDLYWDYNSVVNGYVRNNLHPIMAGYTLGSELTGSSSNARYFNTAIEGTSAEPYYTSLVEPETDNTYSFISVFDNPAMGKIVQIWISDHWANEEFHQMILNTLDWFADSATGLSLTLSNPKSGQTITTSVNIKWETSTIIDSAITCDVAYWNGVEWIDLVIATSKNNYRWNTMGMDKDIYYKIKVIATDGIAVREAVVDGLTINNNLIFAYIVPVSVLVTGAAIGAGFYISRRLKRGTNLG